MNPSTNPGSLSPLIFRHIDHIAIGPRWNLRVVFMKKCLFDISFNQWNDHLAIKFRCLAVWRTGEFCSVHLFQVRVIFFEVCMTPNNSRDILLVNQRRMYSTFSSYTQLLTMIWGGAERKSILSLCSNVLVTSQTFLVAIADFYWSIVLSCL